MKGTCQRFMRCLLLCWLLSGPFQAFAQQQAVLNKLAGTLHAYTDSLLRSSVYLKTSKDIYESGEDLWFKALVLDAQYHNLFSTDKTLYLKLVQTSRDSVVWEEKYPIHNGITSGHVFLSDALPNGDYRLCAYSAHSFYRNMPYYHGVKLIRVVRDSKSLINAKLAKAPAGAQLPQDVQLSLLPEGGRLVSGLSNTVGFKAVDKSGAPVNVSGELLQGNAVLKKFKSLHAGMGSFSFKPRPGAEYWVRLTGPESGKLFALPAIQQQGVVLHLTQNRNDTLAFTVLQTPGSARQQVFLRLQVRGRVQAMAAGLLSDSLTIKIPTADAMQGIAEATLFDEQMRPVAERLVFLNAGRVLHIAATLSKENYKTREKVSLKIKTTDKAGLPVQASVGVNVFDRLYQNPADGKDILTHYYFSANLKGKIYNPAYYFDAANTNRYVALDMLLLTQGWRCYLWNDDELKEYKNARQMLTDSIIGRVVARKAKKNKPKPEMLMNFSTDEREKHALLTDHGGRFALGPDDFVKGRWSYLKRFNESKDEYTVLLEEPFAALKDADKHLPPDDAFTAEPHGEDDKRVLAERIGTGNIKLNEVKIVAKKDNVFRDKYMGRLDSLAKLEGPADYVGRCGWLNCPACLTGKAPVEGRRYTIWIGDNPPNKHPFTFGMGDAKDVVYHYPKFTEEELLKKFKLTRIKGYYEKREFYQPDYDKEPDPLPDYRNTLLWAPEIITDKNGEATLTFFCSDINSGFTGTVEGIGPNGLLGKTDFHLSVVK